MEHNLKIGGLVDHINNKTQTQRDTLVVQPKLFVYDNYAVMRSFLKVYTLAVNFTSILSPYIS